MKSSFPTTFLIAMAMMVGALVFVVGTDLLSSVSSGEVFALWWTSRALGVLAYLGLWLSVLFGVLVSSRGAGGLLAPGMMIDLHTRCVGRHRGDRLARVDDRWRPQGFVGSVASHCALRVP